MRVAVSRLPRPALLVASVAFALVALSCLHALSVAWEVRAALDAPGADLASVRASTDAVRMLLADAAGLALGVALGGWAGWRLHREDDGVMRPALGAEPVADPAAFLAREPEDRVRPQVLSRRAA